MKILVTNDDGISSPGLHALARWASMIGEVTVVAPKTQQSGKSHAITLGAPFEIREAPFPGCLRAYSVDSTPADCVRFALLGLGESFDLLLSGINRGFNLGGDIVYSGTVGAAYEAAYFNIRSLALSTDLTSFDGAAASLDRIYEYICRRELFAHSIIYNINIPAVPGEIRITRQGGPYFRDVFRDTGDGMYQPQGSCIHQNRHDHTVDADAVTDGFISITPLSVDHTARDAYERLK